jgi:phage I-like protein
MTKGTFYFTPESAARIMANYAQCGVDMMIDLEHEALDEPIRADSRDARGWYGLELRGGELWAVNVRWTEDGSRRLASKTQRYISPAFGVNPETGEILDLTNCALVAMPATHDAPALVAASRRASLTETDKVVLRKALEIVKLRASKSRARLGRKP